MNSWSSVRYLLLALSGNGAPFLLIWLPGLAAVKLSMDLKLRYTVPTWLDSHPSLYIYVQDVSSQMSFKWSECVAGAPWQLCSPRLEQGSFWRSSVNSSLPGITITRLFIVHKYCLLVYLMYIHVICEWAKGWYSKGGGWGQSKCDYKSERMSVKKPMLNALILV